MPAEERAQHVSERVSDLVNHSDSDNLIVRNYGEDTFEALFFKRAFFLGETQLDRTLYSLLQFSEACKPFGLSDGRTVLVDLKSIQRKCKSVGGNVKRRFKTLEADGVLDPDRPDTYLQFCMENQIALDRITEVFPLIFEDYRKVMHCLKLSRAFLVTMKMYRMDNFKYLQRVRKGRGTEWDKTHCLLTGNYLSTLFVHFYSSLRRIGVSEEKAIIKCFKNSLCYHVSESLQQEELPEGDHFDLVPFPFRQVFKKLSKDESIRFFFSALQSKSLCEEVPETFIQETLEKHREQLSAPHPGISLEYLEVLKNRGKEFGSRVAKYYKPTRGFNPSNKATFGFPRNMGGVKGDLVYHQRLHNSVVSNDEKDRIEPYVIGLFGQPGQGKSSRLPELINSLSVLFPGISRDKLVYERTCNVEHWDGYEGQPIVILDDLGQSKGGADIKEFQTLVSCNPYVLPMADLPEKGMMFKSPIIICTSNLRYGDQLHIIYEQSAGIIDDASFWRRFHLPLYVENSQLFKLQFKPLWVREENLVKPDTFFSEGELPSQMKSPIHDTRVFYQRETQFQKHNVFYKSKIWTRVTPQEIKRQMLTEYRDRVKFHDNFRKTWTQVIDSKVDEPLRNIGRDFWADQIEPYLPESLGFDCSPQGTCNSHSLTFSAFPPDHPLPVRVQPIVEPLKVRTITAGIGDTFCLKPFQRACWLALGEYSQFCLTHGTNNLEPNIARIFNLSDEGDVWISGDYTAATDSFAIEASKALLEGILESIDHEPTRRWAMKEISPHLLVYPVDSGLEPVMQQSGQLMGSLLSFPLLCLLNDCTAQSIGLSPEKYLINGDDILMRCPASKYPLWKESVREFGLELSLGKNYIHPDYGTVNSQLICGGSVLFSGKQKVLDRRSQVLGECLRDLEVLMGETSSADVQDLFKSMNRSKLSRTVRSISVPVSHGGLAFDWGRRDGLDRRTRETESLVYLHDLFRRIEPDKGCLAVPYLSSENFQISTLESDDRNFNEPVDSKEFHEDFIGLVNLQRVKRRIRGNHSLRESFLNTRIEDLPPLSFLRVLQVPFKDTETRGEIQSAIDHLFLKRFFDTNSGYTYEEYKKEFLDAVKGTRTATTKAVEYLTPIIELEVKPDHLLQVVTGYKAKLFDFDKFEGSFNKCLQPKYYPDLSIPENYADFSVGVRRQMTETLEFLSSWNDAPPEFATLSWKEIFDTQIMSYERTNVKNSMESNDSEIPREALDLTSLILPEISKDNCSESGPEMDHPIFHRD